MMVRPPPLHARVEHKDQNQCECETSCLGKWCTEVTFPRRVREHIP